MSVWLLRGVLFLCVGATPFQFSFSQDENTSKDAVEKRLNQRKIQEDIEKSKVEQYRELPGGVFKAPKLYKQLTDVMDRFQRTRLVDDESVFNLYLASTNIVNGWIAKEHSIAELNVFHVVLTKGLLDACTGQIAKILENPELRKYIDQNSGALVAAVLAHELGHAMNGDHEKGRATTRVYDEFDADEFAVRLMAEAGYDPEAVIYLMKIFEAMKGEKSLRQMLHGLLDEHPKPKYRIAYVAELVDMLKNSYESAQELGYTIENPESIDMQFVLERDLDEEKASKSSKDAFLNKISKEHYLQKELREKLYYIENYMIQSDNKLGGMLIGLVAEIAEEYASLLNEVGTTLELEMFVESVKRFENNALNLSQAKGNEDSGDPKGVLSPLKLKIVKKQLDFSQWNPQNALEADVYYELASEIDARALGGIFISQIKKLHEVNDVEQMVLNFHDFSHRFGDRFKRSSVNKIQEQYTVAAVLRVLVLSNNLEETLDFMQKHMYLKSTNTGEKVGKTIPFLSEVMAALIAHILKNPHIEYGRFHERMRNPSTASDRTFSKQFFLHKPGTATKLLSRLGATPNMDPLKADFRYGTDRRVPSRTHYSEEEIELLQRCLGDKGVQFVFNSSFKRFFSIEETLDLLVSHTQNKGDWNSIREEILRDNPQNSERELETQLKLIEQYLRSSKQWNENSRTLVNERTKKALKPLESATERQKDLFELYLMAPQVIRENAVRLNKAFSNVPFIQFYNGSKSTTTRCVIPAISNIQKKYLSTQEKVEYYDALVKNQIESTIEKLNESSDYEELRTELVEVFNLLKEEDLLIDATISEFFEVFDPFIEIVEQFGRSEIKEFPEVFFKLRRALRFQMSVLISGQTKLEKVLSKKNKKLLGLLCDHSENEFSSNKKSLEVINTLLVPHFTELVAYLKDPENNAHLGQQNLDLIVALVDKLAFYQGLGSSEALSNMTGEAKLMVLAQDVLPARLKNTQLKAGKSEWGPSYVPIERVFANPMRMLSDEHRQELMPLGPGFEYILDDEFERTGSRDSETTVFIKMVDSMWAHRLAYAVKSLDPVEALVFTLSHISFSQTALTEEVSRLFYLLLMNTLERVNNKQDMDTFASIFALYLKEHPVGMKIAQEFFNADVTKIGNLSAARYREHFFNRLSIKLNEYDSWRGQGNTLRSNIRNMLSHVHNYIYGKAAIYKHKDGGPAFLKMWLVNKTIRPMLVKAKWWQKLMSRIQKGIAASYTDNLIAQETDIGSVKEVEFLKDLRENTPWSKVLDESIFDYIKSGDFESRQMTPSARRDHILEVLKSIRSLDIRSQAYRWVLDNYGGKKMGLWTKGKAWINFIRIALEAERIWTEEVLRKLENAPSLIAKWKIKEQAWEDHVKKRCKELNIPKEDADAILIELYQAKLELDHPFAGEVANIFVEGSRHRDEFLEEHAKSRALSLEMLRMLESYKSKKSETPYHKISKAMFEFLDEYLQKLTPMERATTALYLGNYREDLPAAIQDKIKKMQRGSGARDKAVRDKGAKLSFSEVKELFQEAHPEEKMLAFRALFVGDMGIQKNAIAMKYLAQKILMADSNMPEYLRKILLAYLSCLNENESAGMYSSLLSQHRVGEKLTGPDVVRYMIEQGGAVPAKIAQLIASHGFHLPAEYQEVLEKFKSKAQNVDKIIVFGWLAQRLPEHLFKQIKSLDMELGSGSLKIAYMATLKDGRKIVLKFGREFIHYKTVREFEILRQMTDIVMNAPELRIENLPGIEEEVERIIREEMSFQDEVEYEKSHKKAVDSRPLLVKWYGSSVKVMVPQPLEEWSFGDIMAEEYVDSKSFGDLPATSMLGWSQEKLSKAAIDEIINQLLSFTNEDELVKSQHVLIDIDPHEENQLAAKGFLGIFGKRMVNIDLGQSVYVHKETIEKFVSILASIYLGKFEETAALSEDVMIFQGQQGRANYLSELAKASKETKDPFEIFIKAVEEVELAGNTLKPEYLFFQKLFATIIGLKRHVRDPHYVTRRVMKVLALRGINQPSTVIKALKETKKTVEAAAPPKESSELCEKKLAG